MSYGNQGNFDNDPNNFGGQAGRRGGRTTILLFDLVALTLRRLQLEQRPFQRRQFLRQ